MGELIRNILIWISTIGGILSLLFLLLDRFGIKPVSLWLTGSLFGGSLILGVIVGVWEYTDKQQKIPSSGGTATVAPGAIGNAITGGLVNSQVTTVVGETADLKQVRIAQSLTAVREELERVLQSLASQITWTKTARPEMPNIPRRPGETKEQFEDRARDEFARWIEYVISGYQQFPLSDSIFIAQRSNVASYHDADRRAAEQAHAAVGEARNRVFLYRKFLQELLQRGTNDSTRRIQSAKEIQTEAVIHLSDQWLVVLQNWLLLRPSASEISMVERVSLPRALATSDSGPKLVSVRQGWDWANRQRAQLIQEKMRLIGAKEEALTTRSQKPVLPPAPNGDSDALSKAGLAYLQGNATDALQYLEWAARRKTLTVSMRNYVETSIAFLKDPDAFDGTLGVYLAEVAPNGLASAAGLEKGDVVLRYDGTLVKEPAELAQAIAETKGAPSVTVEVMRKGARIKKYVKGGESLMATGSPLVVLTLSAM